MKILAVDNIRQRLAELEETIKAIFPNAAVKSFIDPMMAAQYGVRQSVDIIIAETKMKHINGFEMARVVHKFNSDIRIYLIKEESEIYNGIDDSEIAGWLERPNIMEQLRGYHTVRGD